MGSRLDLHELLCTTLNSRNVYYQPPENFKMNYPAIEYHRNRLKDRYANDRSYIRQCAYDVTLIDKDPDSPVVEKLKDLKYSEFDRHYVVDNLNHDVFTIYY